ncbi:MAG: head-tail joining protein [Deltaproteobacteria bacterium]|nr:head-tail joining protein [Deltaproteobacteria bacterium]
MTTLREQIEGSDLDAFMDAEAGFAREVIITGSTYGPLTVKGIFDERVPVVNDYTGEVENTLSAVTLKTSEIPEVRPHDTVTVGAVTYEVLEIKPDGTGLTTLTLNKTG